MAKVRVFHVRMQPLRMSYRNIANDSVSTEHRRDQVRTERGMQSVWQLRVRVVNRQRVENLFGSHGPQILTLASYAIVTKDGPYFSLKPRGDFNATDNMGDCFDAPAR